MSDTQPNDLSGDQPAEAAETPSDELSGTQPSVPSSSESTDLSDTHPRRLKFAPSFFWISVLILVAAILLGGASGYGAGMSIRMDAQATLQSKTLGDQFNLAVQDFALGNYDVVRQRLTYIMSKDPKYPGAAELLTKVIVQMAITPTLTLTPTPSITPTPDLRSQNTIFAQAQQDIKNKAWTDALAALDALRKSDASFKTAQVDSMYYAALRNRGVDQILGNGAYAQTTNLEGGIYDLTLAERFGPLDGTSDGLRSFARLYITGASFWDLDWSQAINYFGQVYQFTPNMRDSSNITATQRYAQALLNYGDLQAAASRLKDRCLALNSWSQSNSVIPLDATYQDKFNKLNFLCNPPTVTPTAVVGATPTP